MLHTALGACLALLPSCREMSLREAMGHVQEKYVDLAAELEAGSNFGARDAARELRKALESPAIPASPHGNDPEFMRFLAAALESTGRVETEARKWNAAALEGLRAEVSSRCDGCHRKFRTP